MKFRLKVVLCIVAINSILFSVGSSLLISNVFENALEREQTIAKNSYQMIVTTLSMVNEADTWSDYSGITKVLNNLFKQNKSTWETLELSGKKGEIYRQGNKNIVFRDFKDQLKQQKNTISFIEGKKNTHYLQISGVFLFGEETLYLNVVYNISDIYESRNQQEKIFHYTFLLMIFICAVVAFVLSYILTKPLSRLSYATKEFASGNYTFRSPITSQDEIGAVSKDFNQMADQVQVNILQMEESLERQNKFLENFTHELKTPMTSIIGYADLLRSQSLSEEEKKEAADYIYSEGRRLERLSLKLLEIFVTNQQEIELIPNDPGAIITRIVDHLSEQYSGYNISFKTEIESGNCLLEEDLFYSLIENLIDNARKAFDGEGIIQVVAKPQGEGYHIVIKDNGRGIPKEALRHLSEAFYRVDKSRSRALGGAGLGLALCQKIVAFHGGKMSFDSEEGVGTSVTIDLKGGANE